MLINKLRTAINGAFSVSILMAGLWYPLSASALGLKGGGLFGAGENENLVLYCTWRVDDASWVANPGDTSDPDVNNWVAPKVTVDIGLAHCKGYLADQWTGDPENDPVFQEANNEGDFEIHWVNNLPFCFYSDNNRGGGNEQCVKFNDPDNPGAGSTKISSRGLKSGITCENDGLVSRVSYKLFCEAAVAENAQDYDNSYLLWKSTTNYLTAPTWVNACTGTDCTTRPAVRLGGFPVTFKKGQEIVNETECNSIFPATGLLEKGQVLLHEETRNASCIDPLTPDTSAAASPGNAALRSCDSGFGPVADGAVAGADGFDDTFRRCPPISVAQ